MLLRLLSSLDLELLGATGPRKRSGECASLLLTLGVGLRAQGLRFRGWEGRRRAPRRSPAREERPALQTDQPRERAAWAGSRGSGSIFVCDRAGPPSDVSEFPSPRAAFYATQAISFF